MHHIIVAVETKDTDIEADSEISIISLPLSFFLSNVVPSLTLLRSRLLKYQLPSHWVIANDAEPLTSSCSNYISIAKLKCHESMGPVLAKFTVCIDEVFAWNVHYLHHDISTTVKRVFTDIPKAVLSLLCNLDLTKICIGNPEERYFEVTILQPIEGLLKIFILCVYYDHNHPIGIQCDIQYDQSFVSLTEHCCLSIKDDKQIRII